MNRLVLVSFIVLAFWVPQLSFAEPLHVGASAIDITPPKNVALWGQFHLRYSTSPETPLTANIVALKSGDTQATLVSVDLLHYPDEFLQKVRDNVAKKDPSIDPAHIMITATHTHTAPVLPINTPGIPEDDKTMSPLETQIFIADRISDGIVAAWKNLAPGKMCYGLDRTSIGFGRRVCYADGHAQMYGNTNQPDFVNLEGMDDDDLGAIYFLDASDKVKAIIVDVACTAQVVEGQSRVNADFWHPCRIALKKRFGEDVTILGWSSPAGDMSPRPLVHKEANARMRRLRGINEMDEITRRIGIAVDQIWQAASTEKFDQPIFKCRVEKIDLPLNKITEAQYLESKANYESCEKTIQEKKNQDIGSAFMGRNWYKGVVDRYEELQKNPNATRTVEIFVIRLGDLVIASNPFELYTEYGIRIKARSKATQTFTVQMTGFGSYLPTARAQAGGHYSAIPQSNIVGPEGGQKLVDETVRIIGELWQ